MPPPPPPPPPKKPPPPPPPPPRPAAPTAANALYARLFHWLVRKISDTMETQQKVSGVIEVLDIFGFEAFQTNSFEQLCINLANEKLHQQFLEHVFKHEMEEYRAQGVPITIDFADNQGIIDTIERKNTGVFAVLHEQCQLPKGSDEAFLQTINNSLKGAPGFSTPKLHRDSFTINHYAGEVIYCSKNFLEKNKDTLHGDLQAVLDLCGCPLMRSMLGMPEADGDSVKAGGAKGGGRNITTVANQFKEQLRALVSVLGSTSPHYVRCIKPNSQQVANCYDPVMVCSQLRYLGVLETILIRKQGFSVRVDKQEFLRRFSAVLDGANRPSAGSAAKPEGILKKAEAFGLLPTAWMVGNTKVFLKDESAMLCLDRALDAALFAYAQTIQRRFRGWAARRRFKRKRRAAIVVQRDTRRMLARKELKRRKEAEAARKRREEEERRRKEEEEKRKKEEEKAAAERAQADAAAKAKQPPEAEGKGAANAEKGAGGKGDEGQNSAGAEKKSTDAEGKPPPPKDTAKGVHPTANGDMDTPNMPHGHGLPLPVNVEGEGVASKAWDMVTDGSWWGEWAPRLKPAKVLQAAISGVQPRVMHPLPLSLADMVSTLKGVHADRAAGPQLDYENESQMVEGWVHKAGRGLFSRFTWKLTYFRLYNGQLQFFDSEEPYAECTGFTVVDGSATVSGQAYGVLAPRQCVAFLQLNTDNTMLKVGLESEGERDRWLHAIEDEIARQRSKNMRPSHAAPNMAATIDGGDLVEVELPDGSLLAIPITDASEARDVFMEVLSLLGCSLDQNPDHFAAMQFFALQEMSVAKPGDSPGVFAEVRTARVIKENELMLPLSRRLRDSNEQRAAAAAKNKDKGKGEGSNNNACNQGPKACVAFRRVIFTPRDKDLKPAQLASQDSIVSDMDYCQAVSFVLDCPVFSQAELSYLAALQAHIRYQGGGPQGAGQCLQPGMIRDLLHEFLPPLFVSAAATLASGGVPASASLEHVLGDLEASVVEKSAQFDFKPLALLKQMYLQAASLVPVYGCAFYNVQMKACNGYQEQDLVLGVNAQGLHLLLPQKQALLRTFPYHTIDKWGVSHTALDIITDGANQWSFTTLQSEEISKFMAIYVRVLS
eukprot:jgi/Mesvir1/19393/Mv10427-RA.2